MVSQKTSKIFFFKNHAENKVAELVPDHFSFFKKALYKEKGKWSDLDKFITFQTADPQIISILIF